MKIIRITLALVALMAVAFAPLTARAQDADVSFQTFYDQLGSQGQWIQTDDYGYVFQPNVTDPNWAPYTDGRWVYTDDGWTWVSNEPWGWATYHYGRWANIDGTGWVWVPGYTWAPAWVSWRYGGGYAGWAPLPPDTFVGAEYAAPGVTVGVGFHFGSDVDVSFGIGAGCYNFVPVASLGAPNCGPVIVNRYQNFGIINNTTNVTNININRTVINNYGNGGNRFRGVTTGGPSFNEVNARAHNIQRANFTAANGPGRSQLQGNNLAVYAPRVDPQTRSGARPQSVAQTLNQPRFNRGDTVDRPLQVNSQLQAAAPSQQQLQAARDAQAKAPNSAKIARANVEPKNQPGHSFTTMQPVAQPNPRGNAPQLKPNAQSALTGEQSQPVPNQQKNAVKEPSANPALTGEKPQATPNVEKNAVKEPAANPALTGEKPQPQSKKERAGQVTTPSANPAFTGEPNKPASNEPRKSAVQPNMDRSLTGEPAPVKPKATPNRPQPAPATASTPQTFHPQAQAQSPVAEHSQAPAIRREDHPQPSPQVTHQAPQSQPHPQAQAAQAHSQPAPHPAAQQAQAQAPQEKGNDKNNNPGQGH